MSVQLEHDSTSSGGNFFFHFFIGTPFSERTGFGKLTERPMNTGKETKMPKSTSSLRLETGKVGISADDSQAPELVHGKDDRFEPEDDPTSSIRRPGEGRPLEELLRWIVRSLTVMAIMSTLALLCVGAAPLLASLRTHIAKSASHVWSEVASLPLSSLPLLLAGAAYILLQAILRPRPLELLKRLMLGIAFLLWGVVQLMPAGDMATELGNVVIALYVVDLGLIIWTDLQKNQARFAG